MGTERPPTAEDLATAMKGLQEDILGLMQQVETIAATLPLSCETLGRRDYLAEANNALRQAVQSARNAERGLRQLRVWDEAEGKR